MDTRGRDHRASVIVVVGGAAALLRSLEGDLRRRKSARGGERFYGR